MKAKLKSKAQNTSLPKWWTRDEKALLAFLNKTLKTHFSGKELENIFRAKKLGETGHKGQKRKDGGSYIVHPYRVALSLIYEFKCVEQKIIQAAFLHDVIEDSEITKREIAKISGTRVEEIVSALTRTKKRADGGDRLDNAYIQGIIRGSNGCILLKLADKLDNLRDALNHPKKEKRELYVKEGVQVFLPLTQYIRDKEQAKKIQYLLIQAMQQHPFFAPETIDQYFIERLQAIFAPVKNGESIPYKEISQKVFNLETSLNSYLLFNPSIRYWLTTDGVQIVKTRPAIKEIASNISTKIRKLIKKGDFGSLVAMVNLPPSFASQNYSKSWQRVRSDLENLASLLKSPNSPNWILPFSKNPKYLIHIIHSRFYIPASESSPEWDSDLGAAYVSNQSISLKKIETGTNIKKWENTIRALLIEKQALSRYFSHLGTFERVQNVTKMIESLSGSFIEKRLYFAMRMVAEFLWACSENRNTFQNLESEFSEYWNLMEKNKFRFNKLRNEKRSPANGFLRTDVTVPGNFEILELENIIELISNTGCTQNLNCLLQIVNAEFNTSSNQPLTYVTFNSKEIIKRKDQFFLALKEVTTAHSFLDLHTIGIDINCRKVNQQQIITIQPAKWMALKNRLPELTKTEIETLKHSDTSGTKIFDVLLTTKIRDKRDQDPIWMSRVYRILDSMADLDPENVQEIKVEFPSASEARNYSVYLPLPNEPNNEKTRKEQAQRKDILTRYIVATIFNNALTIGETNASIISSAVVEEKRFAAFTNQELRIKVAKIIAQWRYDTYVKYLQKYKFESLRIQPSTSPDQQTALTTKDMKAGNFIGIDIGGTNIKTYVFIKGKPFQVPSLETFPEGITLEKREDAVLFIQRILKQIDTSLPKKIKWNQIDGIGISWPGAVRNMRIAAPSGTLAKLEFPSSDEESIHVGFNDSLEKLEEIDFLELFREVIVSDERAQTSKRGMKESITLILENDGNAEAYGNVCWLEMHNRQSKGNKLIIKLGTSLAGGHVNANGDVSPHLAEYSRMVVDFRIGLPGFELNRAIARESVSSIGIRKLSRTFSFNGQTLFGELGGKNSTEDPEPTRIEAIELGKLLDIWRAIDDQSIEFNQFLDELVTSDNLEGNARYAELKENLHIELRKSSKTREKLLDYILERGQERLAKESNKRESSIDPNENLVWQKGVDRLSLFLEAKPTSATYQEIPENMNLLLLSEKILGTVGLFSQLGLHIAHLIVQLYNIYKSDRINEVILTGGPLTGTTGEIVKCQVERFLLKYYDKVYGPGKNLIPGSIVVPQVNDPAILGPFGVAMMANRLNKATAMNTLLEKIELYIRSLYPGSTLTIHEVEGLLKLPVAKRKDIKISLETLIEAGLLLPDPTAPNEYIKPLARQ